MISWPIRLSFALLGGAAGCSLGARPTTTPPRPGAYLTVFPRIAFISPTSSGVRVAATLRVTQPTPALRCAAELWEWGDQENSGHAEDCTPEDLEPWISDAPLVFTKGHIYRQAGDYEVSVMLVDARGVLARATTKLQIIRPGMEPE